MARSETRNGTWGQIIKMPVNFAESTKLILKEMGSHRKLHASETIQFALSCDPESNWRRRQRDQLRACWIKLWVSDRGLNQAVGNGCGENLTDNLLYKHRIFQTRGLMKMAERHGGGMRRAKGGLRFLCHPTTYMRPLPLAACQVIPTRSVFLSLLEWASMWQVSNLGA